MVRAPLYFNVNDALFDFWSHTKDNNGYYGPSGLLDDAWECKVQVWDE